MTTKPYLGMLAVGGLLLQPLAVAAQSTRPLPAGPSSRPTTATTPGPRATASTPVTPPATAAKTTRPWNEQEYRLGPGDKLRIEVYGENQLSQSLQVRPDGKITLPLIGDILAVNRTSIELRDAVSTSLKEYVTNPVVTVIVQEATAAQVDVIGEVAHPGPQVMQGPLTVLQALSRAGGLKEFADRSDIRILRKTGTGIQTIDFNYKDALKGRIEPVFLQPGDTVVVP